jgi:hypothetical protein
MEQLNIAKNLGKEYRNGSKSSIARNAIMSKFHKEVERQILLGNRVILPGGIVIEIIRHLNDTGKVQPRLGFNYKVRITYDKLKVKKVKFTPAVGLEKKLEKILKQTDFEYKMVANGYK